VIAASLDDEGGRTGYNKSRQDEAVGADTPAGRRLEETRRFYAFLLDEMPRLMERWRKVRSESAAEGGV